MKLGALDLIPKPPLPNVLIHRVEQALAQAAEHRSLRISSDNALRKFERLTARERQILDLLVAGHPAKAIAVHFALSVKTVQLHRSHIFDKLEIQSLPELVRLRDLAEFSSKRANMIPFDVQIPYKSPAFCLC